MKMRAPGGAICTTEVFMPRKQPEVYKMKKCFLLVILLYAFQISAYLCWGHMLQPLNLWFLFPLAFFQLLSYFVFSSIVIDTEPIGSSSYNREERRLAKNARKRERKILRDEQKRVLKERKLMRKRLIESSKSGEWLEK